MCKLRDDRLHCGDPLVRVVESDQRFRVVPSADELDLTVLAYADAVLRRLEAAAADALPCCDRVRDDRLLGVRRSHHCPTCLPFLIHAASSNARDAYLTATIRGWLLSGRRGRFRLQRV